VFRFESKDVPVKTSLWVRERLGAGKGGWIYGHLGSGKSHAVRKAVEGGIKVDVVPGPLLSQRFALDLARQLGKEGRLLLQAFRSEGLEASLEIASSAVNGYPLVVDSVDRLLPAPSNLEEPAATLWQDEKGALLAWLNRRVDGSPTFLVGRRHPSAEMERQGYAHEAPEAWPIRLVETADGFRNWPALAARARNNPAVLTLARALVPFLTAGAFNDLIAQAEEDEVGTGGLLNRLGQVFQSSAPPSWQRALALIGTLGEVPRDTFDHLIKTRDGFASSTSDADLSAGDRAAFERMLDLRLLEERDGVLSLLPALAESGSIRALTRKEREELLPAVAHTLLAPINDPHRLDPEHTARVLRAHAIFVELGDVSQAERTATLHVHGLVDLARRTSQDKRHGEAWRQYDAIFRMMQSGPWSKDETIGRRLFSYVRHYRTRDGALAGELDVATCLDEYRLALRDWPTNALWHQRVIEALIRLGRPIEAKSAVQDAYKNVEEHPRRDELLRVRPAHAALASVPLLSLELIEPLMALSSESAPEVADGRDRLLRRWENGVPFSELPFHLQGADADGNVVLHAPVLIYLRQASQTWMARMGGPLMHHRLAEAPADRPHLAVDLLARQLADETRRLVSTPSSQLGAKDVRLKGLLLSVVDVLNSDIGLDQGHAAERWIVGRIEGSRLVPTMRHLPPIEIPEALLPETEAGLYFVRVPVHRDGLPRGPAVKVEPAGSGLDTAALLEMLSIMSEGVA
jgi:hypothetical protein